MILKTLHGKLSLLLLGLLCLIVCLSVPLTLFTAQRYQQEVAQNRDRTLAASLASHLAKENLLSQNPKVLRKARAEIKALMVINPNIYVYLLDAHGAVLAYSGAPGEVRRSQVALAPLRRFLGGSVPLPILGDDPRTSGGQKPFSVAPFPVPESLLLDQAQGYVYVILSGQHDHSVTGLLKDSYILRSGASALIAILALVSVAGLLFFRLLTRRLRLLTASMEAFQDQDYREPEAVLSATVFTPSLESATPRDEIDRLGMVYLQMSNRIRGQIQGLAQADTYRREMVSNVSHDLRTPLAALQGYLETLLMKEGRMTPQEQREYLQVAIRHSERLAKLVGELFELAQLDSREVSLHFEPFSLSELVQDIVQQQHLAAQQKSLRLQALLPDDLPFVYADIAMIERVLVNLLENALRYTPEGGSITLRLRAEGRSVVTQIADTGTGIRQEDLPHIFERFYRVPSQPEKLGCAGLGLAIVKRILELHDSDIKVESITDQGTSFTFFLPVHEVLGA